MNNTWSSRIQGIRTLWHSRALRFSDVYKEQFMRAFSLPTSPSILDIGCGPGALCRSLKRWYPEADVFGIDPDSVFIEHAKANVPDADFREGDATALAFPDASFDVTISNTVAEHIEPEKFFSEQYRVLKDGGVCLVLSTRKSITQTAPCVDELTDFEQDIWRRAEEYTSNEDLNVCRYPMSEAEYPAVMEKHGFKNVTTDYVTINLTPDDPRNSRETALEIINEARYTSLDAIEMLRESCGGKILEDEINEMLRLANARFDRRIELYDAGEKQWDTNIIVIMVIRGIK